MRETYEVKEEVEHIEEDKNDDLESNSVYKKERAMFEDLIETAFYSRDKCRECEELITTKTLFEKFPQLLVVQLNRVNYEGEDFYKKETFVHL